MAGNDAIAAALAQMGPMMARATGGRKRDRYGDQIEYGNKLMQTGASSAPVGSWVEGIARALQAPLGGYLRSEAADAQEAADATQRDEITGAFDAAAKTGDFNAVARALANIPGQEGTAATLMLGNLSDMRNQQRAGNIAGAYGGNPPPASAPGYAGGYLPTVANQESGGNPRAVNPQSGAAGLYQFMPQTWAAARQAVPGLPASAIEATPDQQRMAAEWLTQQNAAALAQATGRPPSPSDLRLAHYFGAGGASALMRMDPNTPFERIPDGVLGAPTAVVIQQNPNLRGQTVGALMAQYRAQFDGQPAPAVTPVQYAGSPNASRPMTPADIAQNGWQPIPQAGPDQGTWGPQAAPMPRPGSVPQRPLPPAPAPAVATPAPQQDVGAYGAGGDVTRTQPGFTGQPVAPLQTQPFAGAAAMYRARGDALMRAGDQAGGIAAYQAADKATAEEIAAANKQFRDPAMRGVVMQGGVPTVAPTTGALDTRLIEGQVDTLGKGVSVPDPTMPGIERNSITRDPKVTPAPFNEIQGRASGFADRMIASNDLLSRLDTQGAETWGRFKEALPGGIGNFAQSKEYQQFKQARDDFINAQLRRESGAVIGPNEYAAADAQYFPKPGDSPEVIAQKAESRRRAVAAMIREGGPGYRPAMPVAAPPAGAPANPGRVLKWTPDGGLR